jgi:hypothetical protein
VIRGIEGRNVFRDNKDLEDFFEILEIPCPEIKTNSYVWAFLSNSKKIRDEFSGVGFSEEGGRQIAKNVNI